MTWNDKYLDYEIETFVCQWIYEKDSTLETTSTSITRLKQLRPNFRRITGLELETTSTSITRLKQCQRTLIFVVKKLLYLKRQVPRLRDWNLAIYAFHSNRCASLKRQVPRLRDWNSNTTLSIDRNILSLKRQVPRLRDWNAYSTFIFSIVVSSAWNDKYLDYEIETRLWRFPSSHNIKLETTSTSITRLKQGRTRLRIAYAPRDLKRQVPRLRDWNDQETRDHLNLIRLETTSTSITRLKLSPFSTGEFTQPTELETTSTSITRLKLTCEVTVAM